MSIKPLYAIIFLISLFLSILLSQETDKYSPDATAPHGSLEYRSSPIHSEKKTVLAKRESVIDSIPAPGQDHVGLGWDGMYLWNGSNEFFPIQIYQIDPVSGVVMNITVTSINGFILGVTYFNGSLWVQEWGSSGTTYEIDPVSGNTLSSFPSPAGTNSRGITNDGTDLWIVGSGGILNNGTAYQVTTAGTVLHTCNISSVIEWPMGASYNTQRGTFFITDDNLSNDINELDLSGTTALLIDQFSHPGAATVPQGITYDGQYLWTTSYLGNWIWKIDIGDPPPSPPENILFVDDDGGMDFETYWETSFGNLFFPYEKWVVVDSGNTAPDSSDMARYTIVVWTTGDAFTSTLTATDTTEIGKYLAGGGKIWLSSQDLLMDIGDPSWMHLSSFVNDLGCFEVTGIDTVMSPLIISTGDSAFTDWADYIRPDGISWASLIADSSDTNSVAMDTTVGLPYFLYFNSFGWENISNESDRDSMMSRVLSWMGFPLPTHDVGCITLTNPPGGAISPGYYDVKGRIHNFGDVPETFAVTAQVYDTTTWVQLFTQTIQLFDFETNGDTNITFGSCNYYSDAYFYTVVFTNLYGDDNPSNDTASVFSRTALGLGDIILEMDVETPTGDDQILGCEFDGYYFYVTGGASGTDPNKIYVVDTTGSLIWTMDQPAHSTGWGWRDLAWDNVNRGVDRIDTLYGSVDSNVDMFGIDLSNGILEYHGSFSGPENPNRALACRDPLSSFYTANFTSYIWDFGKTGVSNWYPNIFNMYGAAYDSDTIDGGWIWWHSQDDLGAAWPGAIEQFDPLLSTFTGVYINYVPTITIPDAAGGICFYEGFRGGDVLFTVVQGTPDAIVGIYVRAHAGVKENPETGRPLVFALSQNVPNPLTNEKTTISYTTTKRGPVSLKIYDISGRLIKTLVDKNEIPGQKRATWNGKDNNNIAVSTGVYFYRLSADGKVASRKMVVVK